MKTILLVSTLLMSAHGLGSDAQNPVSIIKKCKVETEAILQQKKSANKWIRQAPSRYGETFRSPTSEFGQWLELTLVENGTGLITVFNSHTSTVFEWNDLCELIQKNKKALDFSNHGTGIFMSDANLAKILRDQKEGILYIWSPEMVYSAKYLKTFRDAARDLKIGFIPVVGPMAELKSILAAEKNFGVPPGQPKLNSIELYLRNVTIHFPTSVVFKNGKIQENLLVGVFSPEKIRSEIKERLEASP